MKNGKDSFNQQGDKMIQNVSILIIAICIGLGTWFNYKAYQSRELVNKEELSLLELTKESRRLEIKIQEQLQIKLDRLKGQ